MLNSVRNRLVSAAVRETLKDVTKLRCASSKGGKDGPLCHEPPPPPSPCCPPTPDPPPCPPPPPPCGPPCPPPICTIIPDPNNPCNYVPPENPDPDEPDMTRIKKRQCLYQSQEGIPIHLKGGKHNVYLFHFITILGGLTFIQSIYFLLEELFK